ncbi:hypothetical protein [Qipengyuania sp. SM2507]
MSVLLLVLVLVIQWTAPLAVPARSGPIRPALAKADALWHPLAP